MKRKQIYLPEELNEKLANIAHERGMSQSEVIREGMENYVVDRKQKQEKWEALLQEMQQSKLNGLRWDRERIQRMSDQNKGERK